jgi:hypothetical protein
MLNAILKGKKRGLECDDIEIDEPLFNKFSGSEDLLTASVFERLLYLSDKTLSKIILGFSSTFQTKKNCDNFIRIETYQFWPSWYLSDIYGGSRVEPDCFIRSDKYDFIIEAKRWDNSSLQYYEQWAKELSSYREKYFSDAKSVCLLTIGGFNNSDLNDIQKLKDKCCESIMFKKYKICSEDFHLIALTWGGLWRQIDSLKNIQDHEKRIIDDIKHALTIHNIRVIDPVWLNSLYQISKKNELLHFNESSLSIFHNLYQKGKTISDWLNKCAQFRKISNTSFQTLKRR